MVGLGPPVFTEAWTRCPQPQSPYPVSQWTPVRLAQLLNIWSNISRSIYTEDFIGNTPSKYVNLKTGMLLNVDSIKNHHRWRNITVGLLTIGVHMEIFG